MTEILDTDDQPEWHDTLQQPGAATEEETEAVAREIAERDETTQGRKRARVPAAKRPAPLPRKSPIREPIEV